MHKIIIYLSLLICMNSCGTGSRTVSTLSDDGTVKEAKRKAVETYLQTKIAKNLAGAKISSETPRKKVKFDVLFSKAAEDIQLTLNEIYKSDKLDATHQFDLKLRLKNLEVDGIFSPEKLQKPFQAALTMETDFDIAITWVEEKGNILLKSSPLFSVKDSANKEPTKKSFQFRNIVINDLNIQFPPEVPDSIAQIAQPIIHSAINNALQDPTKLERLDQKVMLGFEQLEKDKKLEVRDFAAQFGIRTLLK